MTVSIESPFSLLQAIVLNIDTAESLESALDLVIETVCKQCGYVYGEVWYMDTQIGALRCQSTRYCQESLTSEDKDSDRNLTSFGQLSKGFTFEPGVGIPGRVWSSQRSEWQPDVSTASHKIFLRCKEAAAYGIKAAFGVPVAAHGQMLAVLVFCSDEVLPENKQLIDAINTISISVGRLLQRIKTEEELRNREALFHAFMDNSSAMVFMKDSQGYFNYVNRPLEDTFNVEHGELNGKNDAYFLPENAAKQVHINDLLVLETNKSQSLVESVPTPDGVAHYWRVDKFPFLDATGKKFVGGVAFDITAIKHLEQRLIEEKLEQQKINNSLQAAMKSAKMANQAKSSFLAMMSHEVRTPMNAMLGMAELLGQTALDSQQQDFVDAIKFGGDTLLTVINDILDFSKIESNNLELEIGHLNLYNSIEQVLTLFANQAAEKKIALAFSVEPANAPSCFKGDTVRLRQILSNLVSNSIKFTNVGEVSIQVEVVPVSPSVEVSGLETLDPSPTYCDVHFYVKDTGIGIAPDKISQLFQPFKQVDASINRRYGGTGLGLAISKQLIALMDGEIDVTSEVGKGSTFHFSIRLELDPNPSKPEFVEDGISLEQKRLLIVDSNLVSRKHLVRQAQSWKLDVEFAESIESAFSKLRCDDTFDLIAINEAIYEEQSTSMASSIRCFPSYRTVPLIVFRPQQPMSPELTAPTSKIRVLQSPVKRSRFYNALIQLLLPDTTVGRSSIRAEQEGFVASCDHKPMRILLAEDIPLNQKVALQMLSTCGYKADVAHNGKEAIAALHKRPYDLVLMDVQMPEMDGLEATQKIRTNPVIKQPYIVAMTAHSMQGDREKCLANGMDGYLSKPIRKRELASVLQQYSLPLAQ
ncbi:MAG: response regulator [Cyanobacteria bacterium P01_D01_bin.1]